MPSRLFEILALFFHACVFSSKVWIRQMVRFFNRRAIISAHFWTVSVIIMVVIVIMMMNLIPSKYEIKSLSYAHSRR